MLDKALAIALEKSIIETQNMIDSCIKNAANFPGGSLCISKENGKIYYYHVSQEGLEKYIPKNEIRFIRDLAQKKYEQRLIPILSKKIHLMKKLARFLKEDNIDSAFNSLTKERKALVKSVVITDEEYARQWQAQKYVGKTFKKDVPFLITDKGEKVRSKSELIIANALSRNNVPYKYEFPYLTPTNIVVYPDFTVLNVKTREEFIFEHFGMMNSPDYLEQTLVKLEMYSNKDFFNGRRLVSTFESEGHPLNTEHLERLIKLYFL